MTIWQHIKGVFRLPEVTLFGGFIVLAVAGLEIGALLIGLQFHQKQPTPGTNSASAVEANLVTLETAQAQCAQLHGTLHADRVDLSWDRALVCDVSKDLSIRLGTLRY